LAALAPDTPYTPGPLKASSDVTLQRQGQHAALKTSSDFILQRQGQRAALKTYSDSIQRQGQHAEEEDYYFLKGRHCDLSRGHGGAGAILTDRGVACIAGALAADARLTSLDLSGHGLSEVSARHVARALERNRAITTLDLAGNDVRDGGAEALGRALAGGAAGDGGDAAGDGGDAAGDGGGAAGDGGGTAGDDGAAGDGGGRGPSVLAALSLRGCGVGARGVGLLMDNLARGGARVRRLVLQDNKLGLAAARHIAATLPSNRYLRSLSLRRNNIGDEGLALLAAALVRAGAAATTAEATERHHSTSGGGNAGGNDNALLPGLTALDLSGNGITDRGVRALTEQAGSGPRRPLRLVRLGLRSNRISDDGCAALAGALVARGGLLRNMRQLHLGANPHITGDGCAALFRALCVTVDLARLDLQGCPLHLDAVKALEDALRESPPLAQLVCDGPLTDAVAAALPSLAEAVRTNTTICELELGAVEVAAGAPHAPALTQAAWASAEAGLRTIAGTLSLNRRVLAAERRMDDSSGTDDLGATPSQMNQRGLDDWASASMALMASPTAATRAQGGEARGGSSLREASLPSVHDDAAADRDRGGTGSPPPPLPSIPPPPHSALFPQSFAHHAGAASNEEEGASSSATIGTESLASPLASSTSLRLVPTAIQEDDETHRLQDTRSDIAMLRHELRLLRNSPSNAAFSPSRVAPPLSTPPPSGVLAIQGLYQTGGRVGGHSGGGSSSSSSSSLVPGGRALHSSPPPPPLSPPNDFHQSMHGAPSADELETLFNHVDKNHDGAINVREMILGLRREPELAKLLNLPSTLCCCCCCCSVVVPLLLQCV
jgi:Ran GTPase-activating protein (RanGAP) involved in mRNA processing and transport